MKTLCTHAGVCRGIVGLLVAATATACSGRQEEAAPPATTVATPSAADAPIPETTSPYDALPEPVRLVMDKPFTGDFDALVKRRAIRVAVTFNRTHYFIDQGQERGLTFEALKLFENDLNTDLKTGNLKVHVVIVPMSRDQLYPALASGKVDMVAAMVTVRPELEKLAAFSEPTRTNVSEVVVTGPGAPPIATVDDLAGQEVFVRKGSIYEESLIKLNEQLKARGKPAVVFVEAPAVLEDDDVLEMVNAGLAPITIVDDYLAEFWSKVFTDIKVHKDITVRSGGSLAVAFRKENPKLREVVNTWLRKHGKGDGFRNTIERRYLDNVKYVKNAAADAERKKLQAVVELFKKYGAQYDVDYLLMAAQGYQESTLDQECQESRGRDWRDAGHAADREGIERRRHHRDRGQHPRRREVHAVHDGPVLQGRSHGPAEQSPDDVCVLQRRAGTDQTAPGRDEKEGPRPQRVVRQRRARRLRTDRPRDGHLRQQHLQVLHHLPPAHRAAGATRRRESGSHEAQVNPPLA